MSDLSTIRLWLDDLRGAPDSTWTWVKTVAEATSLMESRVIFEASLDNDLGDGEPQGRDFVAWMDAQACWPTRRVRVHSANAAASSWMCDAIESSGIFVPERLTPRSFIRPNDAFDAYSATVLEVSLATGPQVAFEPGVPPPADYVGPLPFAVVTAWNPLSLGLPDADSRRFNERLEARLTGVGLKHHAAIGRSADHTHIEPSFAIWGLGLYAACELGRNFGQRAIFWVDHPGVTIRDCVPVVDHGPAWVLDFRRLCPNAQAVARITRVFRDLQSGAVDEAEAVTEVETHAPALDPGWIMAAYAAPDQRVEIWQ